MTKHHHAHESLKVNHLDELDGHKGRHQNEMDNHISLKNKHMEEKHEEIQGLHRTYTL